MATEQGIQTLIAFLRECYPSIASTKATESVYLMAILPAPDTMIHEAALEMVREGERFPGPAAINERLRPRYERWIDQQNNERNRLEGSKRDEPPIRDLGDRAAKLIADLAAKRDMDTGDVGRKRREMKEAEAKKKASEIGRLKDGTTT